MKGRRWDWEECEEIDELSPPERLWVVVSWRPGRHCRQDDASPARRVSGTARRTSRSRERARVGRSVAGEVVTVVSPGRLTCAFGAEHTVYISARPPSCPCTAP